MWKWEGKIVPPGVLAIAVVLTAAGASSAQTGNNTVRVTGSSSETAALTPPPVIPSAIFTGVVKHVVDARTVLVERDAPAASAVIANRVEDEDVVPVRLFGVTVLDANSPEAKQAQQFLNQIVGKRIRIDVRQGTRETSRSVRSALVYVLPDISGVTITPQAKAQQKPPSVVLIPTRTADASNTSPDMPRGPVQPNIPTATNIPVPPASSGVGADDCVNYAIVRQGLGKWDRTTAPGRKQFSDAESDAQKNKRGIWTAEKP